eukprot:EG_transcript_16590
MCSDRCEGDLELGGGVLNLSSAYERGALRWGRRGLTARGAKAVHDSAWGPNAESKADLALQQLHPMGAAVGGFYRKAGHCLGFRGRLGRYTQIMQLWRWMGQSAHNLQAVGNDQETSSSGRGRAAKQCLAALQKLLRTRMKRGTWHGSGNNTVQWDRNQAMEGNQAIPNGAPRNSKPESAETCSKDGSAVMGLGTWGRCPQGRFLDSGEVLCSGWRA